eukprot:TRINITY_DN48987_c0_g1_i1.p1 TRINITY_DN48987_c0_g1~~TRINITY_DN48987_c0_g1_i1.p1  ORF type:complete len:932 (+),score=205.64 TRINITY_DN48987_c0_g1_i1:46-2841(+)
MASLSCSVCYAPLVLARSAHPATNSGDVAWQSARTPRQQWHCLRAPRSCCIAAAMLSVCNRQRGRRVRRFCLKQEVETDAGKRVSRTMELLEQYSAKAHPGHCPGRFAGPGPEFDGMIHDPATGRWRLADPEAEGDVGSTALAKLTEADRLLVTKFEAEGGLALTLSNAFRLPDKLRSEAKRILEGSPAPNTEQGEAPTALEDDATKVLETAGLVAAKELLKNAPPTTRAAMMIQAADLAEEREAVMRNVWSDIEFHGGEASNAELVSQLEAQFAGQLIRTAEQRLADDAAGSRKAPQATTAAVPPSASRDEDGIFDLALRDCSGVADLAQRLTVDELTETLLVSRNLGVALDLVGVYLKNYEIDKADLVISRALPLCRQKGGTWLVKGLDKYSAVRMKQFRAHDALIALKEIEEACPFAPTEGWEFHDILYRNFAWCYSALDEAEKCLMYTRKSVEVKKECGIPATWFDIWDLGKAHARLGQVTGQRDEMQVAFDLVSKAAELHRTAEPSDRIMLAKILSNVGEVAMGLGDAFQMQGAENSESEVQRWYANALPALRESYELHVAALGPMKPLAGWAAGTVAHCMVRLEQWNDAREYLAMALKVECTKDSTTPGSLIELIDRVSAVHQQLGNFQSMEAYAADLEQGVASLRARGWERRERDVFAMLLERVATVLLLGDGGSGRTAPRALEVLREAETNVAIFLGGSVKASRCGKCGKLFMQQGALDAHIKCPHCGHYGVASAAEASASPSKQFGPRPKDLPALLQQIRSSIRSLELGNSGRSLAAGEAATAEAGAPAALDSPSSSEDAPEAAAELSDVKTVLPEATTAIPTVEGSAQALGVFELRRNSPPFCTQLRYEPTLARDTRLFVPNVLVGDGQIVTLLEVDESGQFGYVRYIQDEGWVQLRYLFNGTGNVTDPLSSIAFMDKQSW